MKYRSTINDSKVLKSLNYSKKWIKRGENAIVNECLHVGYKLVESRLKHTVYMSMWISIPNQGVNMGLLICFVYF